MKNRINKKFNKPTSRSNNAVIVHGRTKTLSKRINY